MRALKGLVVAMGVLIVAGVAVIAYTIAVRLSGGFGPRPPGGFSAVLDEPAGSHIVGGFPVADRLAVMVQGGGPDRVAIIDLRTGRITARVSLAK
jgi:hypothetical protein